MLLSLVFVSIKSKKTQLCEDDGLNILLVSTAIGLFASLNTFYGDAGINAALSSAYIFFETTQTNFPNAEVPAN